MRAPRTGQAPLSPRTWRVTLRATAPMRLVSYNILDGGKGRETILGDVIEAQRPDVVALVEAENRDVVEQHATRLKMDFVHAPGNAHASALLSRWPIREVDPAALRNDGNVHHRMPGPARRLRLHVRIRSSETKGGVDRLRRPRKGRERPLPRGLGNRGTECLLAAAGRPRVEAYVRGAGGA